jgi:hypothetical protein
MPQRSESEAGIKTKNKTMKAKHLFLAVAALLAGGGLWFLASHKSGVGEMPRGQALAPSSTPDVVRQVDGPEAGGDNSRPFSPKPGQMPRPPDPTRRFTDFTPEQRVEFARKGHGPGG